MKIASILVKDFLGAEHVEVATAAPVQIFCGANFSGKSSTRDAIALALTADLGRVSLKKDAPQLIHDDASSAVCEVTTADGEVYGVTITASGKIADTQKGKQVAPAMPYVLDGQRFARMDEKERRQFLLGLLSIKMDAKTIGARLRSLIGQDPRIERVEPLLRAGFAAAAEDAKQQAVQAKANWRAITAEAYGPQKAETWQAERPAFDAAQLELAQQLVVAADERIGLSQHEIGALSADRQRYADATQTLAGLRGRVAELARRRDKLALDEAELTKWQRELDDAIAKAGTAPRVGLVHDLARALHFVLSVYDGDVHEHAGALQAYEVAHGPLSKDGVGDTAARDRIPKLTQTRDLMASAVRNSMRDLKASEEAAAQAKVLEDQLSVPFDPGPLEQAQDALQHAQQKRADGQREVEALRAQKAAAESADKRTADARAAHLDVQAWEAIADALGPAGIPAQILGEALTPVNARLAQSAIDAEWPVVVIAPSMAITAGGRPYHLLSESEAWRCDAMIAEAIAYISGLRLVVLDRFDVLDLQGRADCLAWLDAAADADEIDSAFLFATLKAMPADLAPTTEAHWVEGGKCVELVLEGA